MIRQKAMWPNKPIEFVKLKNDASGRHLGLFINNKLISVVSFFIEKKEAQFRKFATLPEFQGNGYGSHLLKILLEKIEKEGCRKVWCNARINKVSYYEKFGFKQTKKTLERGKIKFVIMEKTLE